MVTPISRFDWIPRLKRGLFAMILCTSLLFAVGTDLSWAADNDGLTHIVRAGETLSGIAQRYNVGVQQLARYNGITNINQIRVGQRLRIPSTSAPAPAVVIPTATSRSVSATPTPRPQVVAPASPARSGEVSYIVYAGDSLTGIGARFGVSVGAIMARNGLPSTMIYVGQRLIIPANAQPAPTPTAEYQTALPSIFSEDTPTQSNE